MMPPEVLSLFRIVLAVLSFFMFPHKVKKIVLSRSVRNCVGILMLSALNLPLLKTCPDDKFTGQGKLSVYAFLVYDMSCLSIASLLVEYQ